MLDRKALERWLFWNIFWHILAAMLFAVALGFGLAVLWLT